MNSFLNQNFFNAVEQQPLQQANAIATSTNTTTTATSNAISSASAANLSSASLMNKQDTTSVELIESKHCLDHTYADKTPKGTHLLKK